MINNRACQIAFVISIRSIENICLSLQQLVQASSPGDCFVVVNQSGESLILTDQVFSGRFITVIDTQTLGLSRGRNIGIDFIINSLKSPKGIVFPNDLSKYAPDTIELIREHLLLHEDAIAVGSWVSDQGEVLLSPFHKYENSRHVMRAYEPAIVFPIILFVNGLKFDEGIGSGSSSPYQSGEGAHLLHEALRKGYQIISQPQIECINPTTKRSLSFKQYSKKSFYYGAGTGYYLKENLFPSRKFQSLALIFGPVVGYLVGKGYWRTQGFLFTFCNFSGRIYGFIRP